MTSGYVYLNEMLGSFNEHHEPVKIGKSNNPTRRVREQTACPGTIWLLHSILTNDMDWLEKLLHLDFANDRIREDGEWFALAMDQKEKLQDILVLDRIPLGALYGLPGRSIPEGYFSSEPGQEAFADRSRKQLEEVLTEAGWRLQKHEVDVPFSGIRRVSSALHEELVQILGSGDCPALVIARREGNVICTAAWRYSDSLRKVAARARKVRLL